MFRVLLLLCLAALSSIAYAAEAGQDRVTVASEYVFKWMQLNLWWLMLVTGFFGKALNLWLKRFYRDKQSTAKREIIAYIVDVLDLFKRSASPFAAQQTDEEKPPEDPPKSNGVVPLGILLLLFFAPAVHGCSCDEAYTKTLDGMQTGLTLGSKNVAEPLLAKRCLDAADACVAKGIKEADCKGLEGCRCIKRLYAKSYNEMHNILLYLKDSKNDMKCVSEQGSSTPASQPAGAGGGL